MARKTIFEQEVRETTEMIFKKHLVFSVFSCLRKNDSGLGVLGGLGASKSPSSKAKGRQKICASCENF
jgi:hypothetical protein